MIKRDIFIYVARIHGIDERYISNFINAMKILQFDKFQ